MLSFRLCWFLTYVLYTRWSPSDIVVPESGWLPGDIVLLPGPLQVVQQFAQSLKGEKKHTESQELLSRYNVLGRKHKLAK